MEQYGLTSDALAHLAAWASTQHWTPDITRRDIEFVDCIPLRHGSIVIARACDFTMQLPLAVLRGQHSHAFGYTDHGRLLDGCLYQPLLQELLDAATGHSGVPNLLGTGARRLSARGAVAEGVPLGSSVCEIIGADGTWRVQIPRIISHAPTADAAPAFASLEGFWELDGVAQRTTLLTAHAVRQGAQFA